MDKQEALAILRWAAEEHREHLERTIKEEGMEAADARQSLGDLNSALDILEEIELEV